MTSVAPHSRAARTQSRIDVRCGAELPQRQADEGRCQLFAGHDGPHALMFARGGVRTMRVWRTSNPAAASDAESDIIRRPWMFGYPQPAWFEAESIPDVVAKSSN